ncbi:MAG: isoprenyl transferase [Chitinophagales bacterium]|nr:isoprenyl transferase [Chitinophagales bacterium]HAE12789.1 isoprenyl transferase [Bacteroidota bacterium]MCB9022142.1 isoprenyl transferase [Chitinophagales bacterium]MCB9031958.1 isoprenyl transferase [Chitinophagales bacterium]HAE34715.1 isoprenyl transferase [Bacteroidota bacterium]
MSEPAAEQHASIPRHIAIIMDGNGRWAKQHGRARIYGHHQGVESVRKVVEACSELGVEYLTLYAFSTENWKRPIEEVNALMELLVRTIRKETPELNSQNVCIRTIGNTGSLPEDCVNELQEAISLTAGNTGLNLVLALSYSGRSELAAAMQAMGKEVAEGRLDPDTIDEQTIASHLYTVDIPDPELVIRTSGEYRISNYLLWQSAYAEFYFTETLWPDFDKEELLLAIHSFQQRERRFGKISEQLPMKP